MKKMARGAMAILTLIGLSACVDDPQEQINNDDFHTLQAYPEVAFVKAGVVGGQTDSSSVYFRLINDFGYGTPTHLTLKEVTGTIRVRQDTAFRSYYTTNIPGDTTTVPYLDGHLQRWFVYTNYQPGEGTFTVQASNGVETTVHVRVEASNLGALPTTSAVAGQLITINAPAFQKFTQDAAVTYLRGARPAKYPTYVPDTAVARAGTSTSAGPVTSVAADGSSLTFRVATDVVGRITVNKTLPTHSGLSADFTPIALSTVDTLHVPGYGTPHTLDYATGFSTDTVRSIGGTFKVGGASVTTADVGQTVVIGLGGLPGSLGTTPGNVPLAWLLHSRIFIGNVETGIVYTSPTTPAIGADSNSISVHVPAHLAPVAGQTLIPITIANTALNFDPTFLMGQSSQLVGTVVTVFGVAQAGATVTQVGNPAVITVGYITGTTSTFGTTNYAGAATRAAGVQLPIIPYIPSTALTARSFTINDATAFIPFGTGDCVLQVSTGTPAVVTSGVLPIITGKTPIGCKFYRLGLETSRIIDAEVRWNAGVTADVAVYAVSDNNPAVGSAIVTTSTIKGAATATSGGQPQVINTTATTAVNGQYIAVVLYSGAPAFVQIRLTEK